MAEKLPPDEAGAGIYLPQPWQLPQLPPQPVLQAQENFPWRFFLISLATMATKTATTTARVRIVAKVIGYLLYKGSFGTKDTEGQPEQEMPQLSSR